MKKFLATLEKWISAALLLLLGLAGLIIGSSAFLEMHWIGGFSQKIPHLVYATVGLLALALGIERLIPFHRWEAQLTRMEGRIDSTARDILEKSSWAWFLPGERLAFEVASTICQDAEQEIRALAIGGTPRVKTEFAEAIIRLLQLKSDKSLKFTSVYSLDFSNLQAGFDEDTKWRMALHEKAAVSKQASLFFLNQEQQIGLECLLVDDRHTIIGVSDPDTRQYRGILLFRNQPEVTKQLVAWFEDSIVRHAVTYAQLLAYRSRATKAAIEKSEAHDQGAGEDRSLESHDRRPVN
jgi:hypothetical protein